MSRIKPPFKYYGGKFYLTEWIISHFPDHNTYVEPFGGAASVLLNKKPAEREIYNDLNRDLVNLMRFIQKDLATFVEELSKISCEENVYYEWKKKTPTNDLENAIRTFVLYRMSRAGTATTFSKSRRIYRGLPENVAAWETGIENLPIISNRLKNVELRCANALDLIQQLDGPQTLIYLDPPYVLSTRKSKSVYQLEMTEEDHVSMAQLLNSCKSKVIISGYESALYQRIFSNWRTLEKDSWLHGSHQKVKKTTKKEILWLNYC